MNKVVKTGGAVVVGGGLLFTAYELLAWIWYRGYKSKGGTLSFEQWKTQKAMFSKLTPGGG